MSGCCARDSMAYLRALGYGTRQCMMAWSVSDSGEYPANTAYISARPRMAPSLQASMWMTSLLAPALTQWLPNSRQTSQRYGKFLILVRLDFVSALPLSGTGLAIISTCRKLLLLIASWPNLA